MRLDYPTKEQQKLGAELVVIKNDKTTLYRFTENRKDEVLNKNGWENTDFPVRNILKYFL